MRARGETVAPARVRARGRIRIGQRIALAAALCIALAAGVTAWAYWSASAGAGSVGAAAAASVNQGATPTAVAEAGRRVTVQWGTSTLSNGHAVDGYLVKRYDAGSAVLQTTLAGCAGTVTATSCVESGVPAGQWKYSVTPVFAANWQGPEGLKSGAATVAAATLTLDETLFGPPLAHETTGSLTGFAAAEGVSYRLDAGTPLTGSPSSAGAAGTATISSLTIPSTSDGAHTVHALGDASPTASSASAGIVVDTTAPTAAADLAPAPNAAGWNASAPVQLTLSADDGTGSGIDRIRYTTDATDPLTSGTAQDYTAALSIATTTTVRYVATDIAGNDSAVQTQLVRIDLTAPVNLLSLSGVSGGAHLAGATVFYRGTDAGSFTLTNAVSDAGGAGAASSASTLLSGTSTGWSHSASVVTTPSGGPFVSASFGWAAGTTAAPGESVIGSDAAGNTATTGLTFTPDVTDPAAGALTVNGVAASGAGSVSGSASGAFGIVRTDYGDAGSGLLSSVLTLESAVLSSSGGVTAGTCATFGTASVVTGAPSQSVTGPTCYRYTLTGTDRVGNASSVSTIVKVDTTAPSAPDLTISGATGPNTYISGSTVFINPQVANSGSFQVAATTTDLQSGIQQVGFPALTGFAGGGGDDTSSPFQTTYTWAGAVGATGTNTVTATNIASGTASSTFDITPDVSGPTAGALTVNGVAATGAESVSGSASGAFSIARTDYADSGSGLVSSVLTLESAALSSAGGVTAGTCATFGSSAVVTGSPAQSLTGPTCYRYTLTGVDRVGNASSISTVVMVDASSPSAPALTLSSATGVHTYIAGSTAFINPQAANSGTFQVAATATDLQSGIQKINFPALSGFTSGGGDDSSSPFETTYTWSGVVGASGAQTVTATNAAASTSSSTFTLTPDTAGPTGGALTVNGVAATGGGSLSASTSGAFTITGRTDYASDAGAGIASSQLTVQTAALSSADGIVAGTCSTFGSASVLVGQPAQSVTGPTCYRYTLTGTDRVGNAASVSTIVRVDTTAPSAPALTLSSATGSTYITGSTVVISPKAANSGSFQVAATTTDAGSGIQKVNFPALTGFSSGAGDDLGSPFATTYTWSGAVAATGTQTVTSTNTAGGVATTAFTVTPDILSPSVTTVVSKESDGTTAGDGRLELNDRLILTFSEELLPSSVPSTFSATETRAASGLLQPVPPVQLTITSFTNGTLSTGDNGYLSSGLLCILGVCSAGTATFGGTATLSAANTVVTLVVTSLSGDATDNGQGTLAFQPSSTIKDRVGNGASGGPTLTNFRLF